MNLPTTVPQQSRGARIALAALAVLIAFMCTFSVPATALALDTSKTTAKTNSDSGADVLGGKETRVTWEGQAAEGEELSGLSLTFPAGTQFGVDDARVTLLKDGGSERVAVSHISVLETDSAQPEKDFWALHGPEETSIVLAPGSFLVVLPGDAHKLKMQLGSPATVTKSVFKVNME